MEPGGKPKDCRWAAMRRASSSVSAQVYLRTTPLPSGLGHVDLVRALLFPGVSAIQHEVARFDVHGPLSFRRALALRSRRYARGRSWMVAHSASPFKHGCIGHVRDASLVDVLPKRKARAGQEQQTKHAFSCSSGRSRCQDSRQHGSSAARADDADRCQSGNAVRSTARAPNGIGSAAARSERPAWWALRRVGR